jgi:hypothetical protein
MDEKVERRLQNLGLRSSLFTHGRNRFSRCVSSQHHTPKYKTLLITSHTIAHQDDTIVTALSEHGGGRHKFRRSAFGRPQ